MSAVTFKYLYQDKTNVNRAGEIKARSRAEAYALLRKQGIRPYRVIGDDPWNWRPWAVAAGYLVLLAALAVVSYFAIVGNMRKYGHLDGSAQRLSAAERDDFRLRAEIAVANAPEAYRYHVWRSVNAKLEDLGLEPLAKPEGMVEEEFIITH